MANTKHNCNMSLDEILNEEEPAEVTTLYGGDPTVEEAEQAFDELFKESHQAFNNFMNIRR
jgi:threonine aldolase